MKLPRSVELDHVLLGHAQHLVEGGHAGRIKRHALAQGMRTLRDDGIAKALAGVTTLDEVLRVTQEDVVELD